MEQKRWLAIYTRKASEQKVCQFLKRKKLDHYCPYHSVPELDFVGHIGGDDFVVLAPVEVAEDIGEEILERFKEESEKLYEPEDRARGYVEVLNRQHVAERFPLMSLTLAYVSTDRVPVTHLAELIDIAHELKARGKAISGSVIVGERRRRQEPGTSSQKVA